MPIILFVCVENTFKSVMSEAIFNARAPPGWRAESAGVQPAASMNPAVKWLLREIGIEVRPKKPRLVVPDMTAEAWRIITFHCMDRCPPGIGGKNEDWPVPGATGKTKDELRLIRDELSRRIDILIEDARQQPSQ